MSRPLLEVAAIFRDHGAAWRKANAGHVSLGQMKVMSAIERCRTAALGGHVARCENEACAHTVIAYNSCRNRHCPKCQGAAARRWRADREAELLPGPYLHVVYTLPSELRDLAYPDKRRFKRFIAPLRHINWVFYCKAPLPGPQQVLRYLSRYTHRVAISNRRLVAADDTSIAFRWKDYRINGPGRWKTMRLHPHEFIRRFLLHVLPKGFHRIRHYGLFAPTNRAESIATARALLNVAPPAADPQKQPDVAPDTPPRLPCPCPRSPARMIVLERFTPGCEPRWRPTPSRFDTS